MKITGGERLVPYEREENDDCSAMKVTATCVSDFFSLTYTFHFSLLQCSDSAHEDR